MNILKHVFGISMIFCFMTAGRLASDNFWGWAFFTLTGAICLIFVRSNDYAEGLEAGRKEEQENIKAEMGVY